MWVPTIKEIWHIYGNVRYKAISDVWTLIVIDAPLMCLLHEIYMLYHKENI